MNKQEQINESFIEDLGKAIQDGYDESYKSIADTVVPSIYSNVLKVIAKYSAIPNEPKENEVTNS